MRQFVNQDLYPGEFLLHKKYAQSEMLLDLIWTHSNIVADISLLLLEKAHLDPTELPREFVIQASLLFDIGIYLCDGYDHFPGQPTFDRPYIQHGIVGAWLLEQEKYAPQIVQVAYAHTGVGLSREDVRSHGLDLPEADYLPLTPLQQFITYTSKFHSKAPRFKKLEEIEETLTRYGEDKLARFNELKLRYSVPVLDTLATKYQPWHQAFEYQLQQLAQEVSPTPVATLNSAGIAKG